MVAAAPGGTAAGSGLEQVGTCAGIAERGDAVAEGRACSTDLKMLHECEVIFVEIHDRLTTAGDDDQDIGWVRVSIGCGSLRSLHAERE